MATITPRLFSQDASADIDEEQLLRLFWNRAELKKEFAALELEMGELQESVRQKDGLLLRIQQRLNHLEALLADPESAENTVTYYQLRGLWNRAALAMQSLAGELERAGRDKAYQCFIAQEEATRDASVKVLDQKYTEITLESDVLAARIEALRNERHSCHPLFGFFKRRSITSELNLQREKRKHLNARLAKLAHKKQQQLEQPHDEFDGLDIAAKRHINVTVIAYAQELLLLFYPDDIATLARDAAQVQVNDVSYGGKQACREIRRDVAAKLQLFKSDTDLIARTQRRASFLREEIEYRNDQDCVPMALSMAKLPLLDANGKEYKRINVNVLADEYWDLFAALLS